MEENNKIIAEFLGWEKINTDEYIEYILPKSLADPIYKLDSRFILEFDTDWNWLMEVIEKIRKFHNGTKPLNDKQIEQLLQLIKNLNKSLTLRNEVSIEAVYNTCVKFIKWYNQNSEKEK